jgi:hypothetical protein
MNIFFAIIVPNFQDKNNDEILKSEIDNVNNWCKVKGLSLNLELFQLECAIPGSWPFCRD